VIDEVQELSRGVHPAQLAEGGLRPAVRALARRSPIPVDVTVDIPERPPASVETAVYYAVSEALANAIKHSRATAPFITSSAMRAACERPWQTTAWAEPRWARAPASPA
jgi:signal transduction histidine kinase